MKNKVLFIVMCIAIVASVAPADLIRGINVDFVTIGNASNQADTGGTPGCGAVSYNYRIGKYEVTNTQWNDFVTIAGAPTGNPSYAYDQSPSYTDAQQPANYISWYEAAQFCNWLTSGDRSLGVYQLGMDGSITIDRASAISIYGTIYVIPTEDEWYKAAYYTGNGYSTYANGTDISPIAGINANYNNAVGNSWNVGSGTMEQNGTFDMMGNVSEWNENDFDSTSRVIRGGQINSPVDDLSSFSRGNGCPYSEDEGRVGFRIASVPEPATLLLLGLGGFILRSSNRCRRTHPM